jgi:predicted nucleic acid-binding protein
MNLMKLCIAPSSYLCWQQLGKTADEIVTEYRQSAEIIATADLVSFETAEIGLRDPDDYHVIACVVGGKAEYIISGNKDLLTLGIIRTIRILSAVSFWQYISQQ